MSLSGCGDRVLRVELTSAGAPSRLNGSRCSELLGGSLANATESFGHLRRLRLRRQRLRHLLLLLLLQLRLADGNARNSLALDPVLREALARWQEHLPGPMLLIAQETALVARSVTVEESSTTVAHVGLPFALVCKSTHASERNR